MERKKDFGNKIGGARKDLWAGTATLDDLKDLSEQEQSAYITKDQIWKKPDYKKLYDNGNGVDRTVIYFYKTLRDATPVRPEVSYFKSTEETRLEYITTLHRVKEVADEILENNKIDSDACKHEFERMGLNRSRHWYKLYRAAWMDESSIKREIRRKNFLYTEDELALLKYRIYQTNQCTVQEENGRIVLQQRNFFGYSRMTLQTHPGVLPENCYLVVCLDGTLVGTQYKTQAEATAAALSHHAHKNQKDTKKPKRKGYFVPENLKHIKRDGENYRCGKNIEGEDLLNTFHFYGGEYGHWMTGVERQESLNFAFDSFKDLAMVLGVADTDIAFDGKLSIAFGARGKGGRNAAVAHYEPLHQVINLTKMRGAGSLGHEWIHAMDFLLGAQMGLNGAMSETTHASKLPESFISLMDTIKYRTVTGDDAKRILKDRLEQELDCLKCELRSISSRGTDEQEKAREACIDAIIAEVRNTPINYNYRSFVEGRNGIPKIKADTSMIASYKLFHEQQKQIGCHNVGITQNIKWFNGRRTKIASMIRDVLEQTSVVIDTDFLTEAKKLDAEFSRSGQGYWASNVELLARAGAAYLHDKCTEKGIHNDYLCGHAESVSMSGLHIAPQGIDRLAINEKFDDFFNDMQERGFFHTEEEPASIHSSMEVKVVKSVKRIAAFSFTADADGQLSFANF